MKKKNKVLIIGSNGFIGRSLSRVIRAKYPAWQVYEVDKCSNNGDKSYCLDVKNGIKLKRLLLKIKPKYIFQLAGSTTEQSFKDLFLSHVYSSFCLFKTVKSIAGYNPRIIIPSSAAEYGQVSNPRAAVTEGSPLTPTSLYGFSKMVQTNIALFFARQGLDVVVARIFNITGENTPRNFSLGRFAYELARMKRNRRPRYLYTGNLDAKRDFLDICDVSAYLIALAIKGKRGQIYNVCRGRSYSIRFLLNEMIKIASMNNVLVRENNQYNSQRSLADSFGSAKKIRRIIKIKLTPIRKSLETTYKHYLKTV